MRKNIQLSTQNVFAVATTSAMLILILAFLPSCNDAKPEDTKDVAIEHNEAKFDNAKEDDAKFLVSAAEINLEEIQLGKLAQSNSAHADVKELGRMMVAEHTRAQSDLQALADKKQISLPLTLTENGQEANDKLMGKKGKDFDKEYCDMTVSGHKNAINKFEKASTDASDPEVREWATSMLPALRTHLDHAIACKDKCDKM